MILSKMDIERLKQALNYAIDYEESYINAHCTAYAKGSNGYMKPMVVPKQFRQIVKRVQNNIKAWRLLIVKLNGLE